MIVISDSKNPVPVVQIRTSRATSRLATALRAALDDLLSTSRSAALIDLSGIGRMTPSGLGALLEVYSDLQARLPIAFFDGNDRVSALTQHYGLGQVLPVYPDRDSARNSPSIAAHRLRGLKCAVLGHPEPDAALRSIGLSDLLAFDLLGCTVLQRQVRTLASFGLNNVLLWANAALSPRAPSAAGCTGQTVITLPTAGGTGAILGMRDALGDTSQPIILVEAGVLANVDFAKMLDQHISRGAWATVAVPSPASPAGPQPTNLILTPGGRLAPPGSSGFVMDPGKPGVCVLSPAAVDKVSKNPATSSVADILRDLAEHAPIDAYHAQSRAYTINTAEDLLETVAAGFAAPSGITLPDARQTAPGIWRAPEARITRGARITGPVYVGEDAVIHAGAEVTGPAYIGAGCVVERGCKLHGSVVLAGTVLGSNTHVFHRVCGPNGSVPVYSQTVERTMPPAAAAAAQNRIHLAREGEMGVAL